jgi:nucleoside-diphosphate-sugar epimerase
VDVSIDKMKCIIPVFLFSFLRIAGSAGLFTEVPTSLKPRSHFQHSSSRLHSSSSDNNNNNEKKPILVVGATGKVGRKVVEQLLSVDRQMPVRALVRNLEKAEELFADYLSSTTADKNKLELVVCDLSTADSDSLEAAVQGCEAIISVSGAMRFSKLTDFLPWHLFQQDASRWCSDTSHPYYSNYQAQKLLIDLASKHKCSRFVRLTGLSSGFSPFNPVSVIFSSVLSLTSRYHFKCEQYLRNSKVPYVILRPGGLAEDDRVSRNESFAFFV